MDRSGPAPKHDAHSGAQCNIVFLRKRTMIPTDFIEAVACPLELDWKEGKICFEV